MTKDLYGHSGDHRTQLRPEWASFTRQRPREHPQSALRMRESVMTIPVCERVHRNVAIQAALDFEEGVKVLDRKMGSKIVRRR